MLNETLFKHLTALRLPSAAKALRHQLDTPACEAWSFEQRLAQVLDAEVAARCDRRAQRLDRAASTRLLEHAEIAGIDLTVARGLTPPRLNGWATCEWVRHRQNLIVSGPTGVGKSYIGMALGKAAARQGLAVEAWSLPGLLEHADAAKVDGTARMLRRRLERVPLLILDDFLLDEVDEAHAPWLWRLVQARHLKAATLVVSPLPPSEWHGQIRPALTADAIVDRLTARAQCLTLSGPSYRARTSADA